MNILFIPKTKLKEDIKIQNLNADQSHMTPIKLKSLLSLICFQKHWNRLLDGVGCNQRARALYISGVISAPRVTAALFISVQICGAVTRNRAPGCKGFTLAKQ